MNEGYVFSWYNYLKEDYEDHSEGWLPTEVDVLDFIPQYPPAKQLYKLYRQQGYSLVAAMQKTLEACVK